MINGLKFDVILQIPAVVRHRLFDGCAGGGKPSPYEYGMNDKNAR